MSKTSIYFVRHADVENPQNIIYGRLPRFPLIAAGRARAERTASYLADQPIVAIYTSPLLRARQTAEILGQPFPGVPIRISRLLNEVRSSFQGSPRVPYPPGFDPYEPRRDPTDESISEVFIRLNRLVRRVRCRFAGQEVIFVTHGDPILIARVGFTHKPLSFKSMQAEPYPAPASVTTFEFYDDQSRPVIKYAAPT